MLVCYPKQLIVKSIIIVLLFFSSINAFAHKDKLVSETYGNVKTVIMTGFNYLDIDKIKIIGQLTKELSNRLKYRDTILIEYIHDYTNKYSDDLYLLEYNNSNYKLLEDSSIKSNYTIKSNGKGLSVRMYADNINIVDVLKLVEFIRKKPQNPRNLQVYLKVDRVENSRQYLPPEIDSKIVNLSPNQFLV